MILIGALTGLKLNPEEMDREFARFEELSLNACQLGISNAALLTQEDADNVNAAAKNHGITITAVWAGTSGPAVWDFIDGPRTIGIVPEEYRQTRVHELKDASAFAAKLGVRDIITHLGFLPENPDSPQYIPIAEAIRDIALEMKKNGQRFLFESGQETPVTVLRFIEEVGTGNLGVNLDTANLILYGKANPVDALDVIGDYVCNTHFKDGFYPTTGKSLGSECPLGAGKVNVPALIHGLKSHNYAGPYIIEREISGDRQTEDIRKARQLILDCLKNEGIE